MTRDKSFYKNFFKLYIVLVLENVIMLSVNLADNIMIGSYSETALSGVAAVNQVQFVFQQLIRGIGDSIVILGSQYWGQNRTKEIKNISFAALLFGVGSSIFLFTAAAISPDGIIRMFTKSPKIIDEGVRYISIIKYTYPLFAITNVLLATLRTVETVKPAVCVSVLTLVVNCSINYCLIEGHFGAPEMGAQGAAIGTLVARAVETVIIIIYVMAVDKKLCIKLKEYFRINKTLCVDFVKVGWSVALVSTMFGVSTALQTVILGHISDSAIAANSMASTLYQMLKVAAVGAASATSIIIGKTVGAKDFKRVKEYTKTAQVIFLCIGAVISVSLFLLREPILSLYNMTAETKEMANSFMLVMCFTGFGMAYQQPTLVGIVRGGGDASFILKNDLISIWGIVLPISLLAAFVWKWSPVAVVFCLNSDQIFKCAAAAIKVNSYTWIKNLTRKDVKN